MNAQAVAKQTVETMPVATEPASESAAILSVIERMAMNPDIDPERIERFIVLKERIDAANAKKAFDAAIAEAKASIPPVAKNRKGHNDKRYADFAAIAAVVDPIIAPLGLSYRFRTRQDERIHVTCVLTHSGGHSEETTLAGPADASGSKNAIQAIGSTLTYLQRYTLVQALGLAASEDDDGAAAGRGDTISDEQLNQLSDLIEEVSADLPKFCAFMRVDALAHIRQSDFKRAVAALEAKRAAK